jgi:hypothetical protein
MTPEERQLITGLFERMRSFGAPEKDREAEAAINDAVRAMPDAPYMLVQSVLVQEHALREAGKRIEDLEAQVRSLQGEGPPRAPAGSGSFLGGLLGGGRPAAQSQTSVPPIGSRAVPSGIDERPGWGGQPSPMRASPEAGGGFLRSAMTTAAGVAGGMLAAGAISNMLGRGSAAGSGGSGGAGTTSSAQQTPPAEQAQPAKAEQPRSDDAAVQDASYEEDSDWEDGGDFDGMDV